MQNYHKGLIKNYLEFKKSLIYTKPLQENSKLMR